MKIFIDARLYGLENAGIGRYLINLVKYLKKDTKDKYVILLDEKHENLKLPPNWEKITTNARVYSLKEQIEIPSLIKRSGADLVHFPHFNVPLFWNGKFMVTIHDMTMHWQKRSASKLPLVIYLFKRIPYKLVFKKAVKKSKKIIVPTESVRNEISKYYSVRKEKFSVIYEGVGEFKSGANETSVLRKYNLQKDKYFIYVGGLFPHKNLVKAIKAVNYLNREDGKKVKLAIGSSNSLFIRKLKKEAKKVRALKFIKFLGFVPDEDLTALYKNSIAFVYPSLSEGFGLQGLEAIKSKTLVLGSDISVFREIYKNYITYFNPLDARSIQGAMRQVSELGKVRRRGLIDAAFKHIKIYSWEKMADETLKIYKTS